MANINLLPWREELREERKQEFLVGLGTTVVIAAIILFVGDRVVNSFIDHQTTKNNFLREQISYLDREIAEIRELQRQKSELIERMTVIQELQGNRPVIVRLFDELVRALPDGVYYNTITRDGDQISFQGVAESNNRVSALMRSMDDSEWFENPLLEQISAAGAEGEGNSFQLTVQVTAPSSIALGYAGSKGLLELELSALEASGNGEVIAQPKVTTQDQQLARIESGLQIPYQAQAGGTAGGTAVQFIAAVLALEVTPQITPDGRINMLLTINQDSVVPGAGAVPSISTNVVNTRVLVNDGDTIVLGGVFREETTTTVTKTPVLGDLPYIGNLFKRTENAETKTELLIFITPSIINEFM